MNQTLPTIKEMAIRLKVSTSTVSRALSNHPRIGLKTRMEVQKLAKEIGYEANAKAIFFKEKRSNIIGVIVPQIREEFFSEAISGIESIAVEKDYTILFAQSFDDPEREEKVVDSMRKQRVDGLIISLSKQTTKFSHFHKLDKLNIPVVYFDRVPSFSNAHKVYCDLYTGTIKMIQWLFKKGYRRIGLINGPSNLAASKERLKGYIDGIVKQHLKVDMQLVEETDFSKETTCRAMHKLLNQKHPPTAIISFNDYVHMDAVQYAISNNIRVNRDIAFVSYANLPITGNIAYPPLISIEQYPFAQGSKAIEVLIGLIQNQAQIADADFVSIEVSPDLKETPVVSSLYC